MYRISIKPLDDISTELLLVNIGEIVITKKSDRITVVNQEPTMAQGKNGVTLLDTAKNRASFQNIL